MGMYLNPGSKLFEKAKKSKIFVDKSGLIEYANSVLDTNQAYMCVSRPRRFGKTMAMNMLSAYYDCTTDARKLFEGMKIAGCGNFATEEEAAATKEMAEKAFEEYANKYNVLRINALELFRRSDKVKDGIDRLNSILIKDMKKSLTDVDFADCIDIVDACQEAYYTTGCQFVILIDEWDCVFREKQFDTEGQKLYLDFLRNWLKDREYVALAYITGILPIKKYGKHSALNMFREFSMEDQRELEEYTGFTKTDVMTLCSDANMDYEQCKYWYDGYKMRKVKEIYNPLSVVEAMMSKIYGNYWSATETYEALKVYISMNFDGLRDIIISLLAGGRQEINTRKFQNDMTTLNSVDDVLTLLVHLGYLGYDSERAEVFIPNNEVRTEFYNAIEDDEDMKQVVTAVKKSQKLLEATLAGDNDTVAELVEKAHLETSHLQYNDENALSYTVSLAYYAARNKYNIVREFPAGKGFADMVFVPLPNHPELLPIVVELKWDKTADTAIKQIKNKQYPDSLKGYEGEILLVGINYDKKSRKHSCKIERA